MTKCYVLFCCVLAVGPAAAQTSESGPPVGRANFEFSSGATFGLPSSRAVVATTGGIADTGERKVLPSYGAGLNVWLNRYVGAYIDLGGANGGKATARVGNTTSEIQSELMTLQFGVQLQKPGPRFRPYISTGAGPAWISTKGSFRQGNVSIPLDGTARVNAIAAGGGFRYFLSRTFGVRVGMEAVHLRGDGGGKSYTRSVFGLLWQR